MPPRIASTTFVTQAKDAVAVVDAYAKPDDVPVAKNSYPITGKMVQDALDRIKARSQDKELQSVVKDAAKGKIDKDVALDRLKDVVGSSIKGSVGDPKDLKKDLMKDLLKSAGFKADAKNLTAKLDGLKSMKGKLDEVKEQVDKYAGYGIMIDGQLKCAPTDAKGLLELANGAVGKKKFKGFDFGLKFKSLGKLFDKLPDVDGMFDGLMDAFGSDEERDSYLGKGLKQAMKAFNLPHLKLAKLHLGDFKIHAELPDFSIDFLKKYKKKPLKCELPTADTETSAANEIKDLCSGIDPNWNKVIRDDSLGTGKGDGTGGTGQAVVASKLEPFVKMSDRSRELLKNDPDEDMRIDVMIAEHWKSVRLVHLGRALFPGVAI